MSDVPCEGGIFSEGGRGADWMQKSVCLAFVPVSRIYLDAFFWKPSLLVVVVVEPVSCCASCVTAVLSLVLYCIVSYQKHSASSPSHERYQEKFDTCFVSIAAKASTPSLANKPRRLGRRSVLTRADVLRNLFYAAQFLASVRLSRFALIHIVLFTCPNITFFRVTF